MADRTRRETLLLHPMRGRILDLFDEGPHTVARLARRLGTANSTILWHLGKLEMAGLVVREHGTGEGAARFRPVASPESQAAQAYRVLYSVPARELMEHLLRHPGQHLGEAAAAIGAPRSRYWRAIGSMEQAGLLRSRLRVKARLLYPTPLARNVFRLTGAREWARLRAMRTRRRTPEVPPALVVQGIVDRGNRDKNGVRFLV